MSRKALVVAALGAMLGVSKAAAAEAPNVLLLSLDTLRADRVGGYGFPRPTSPTLDALAARGVTFTRVITESSWTLPSHLTLMTGLHPGEHGVTLESQRLPDGIVTLAEILRDRGYGTAAITDGIFVAGEFGFGRGFESYDDRHKEFRLTLHRAKQYVDGHHGSAPWFLFLHTYAVHCPYDPPEEYARRLRTRPAADRVETRGKCGPHFNRMALSPGQVRYLSDRYDAGVREADDQLRSFVRFLEARDAFSDTIVLIVSDHGEEFFEHGRIGHRKSLFVESLDVPMIVVSPGVRPGLVREPVGLVDVLPTLCELVGAPAPPGSGRSLVAAMRSAPAGRARPLFSELDRSSPTRPGITRLRSVVFQDRHLILDLDRGRTGLYDLTTDPGEGRSLSLGEGDALEALLREHLAHRRQASDVPASEFSARKLERLRALGYAD